MAARWVHGARRIGCLLAVVILTLGFAYSAANASFFNLLRQQMMLADLRVDSFALDTSEARVGQALTATVQLSNAGRSQATSTVLTFWATSGAVLSVSDASRLTTVNLGTLAPTASVTHVSTFTVPSWSSGGTYQIFATLETSTSESTTQNNSRVAALRVVNDSPPPEPTPPAVEEPVPISAPDTSPAPNFAVGDRVMTTASLGVRASASATATQLGVAPLNARGRVVGGPASAEGSTWWRIDFDNAPDGWTIENQLQKPMVSRFFQTNSTWYEKIPANPAIMANSANYVARIAAEAALGVAADNGEWSVPVWYARPDTPSVAVRVLGYRNSAVQNDTTVVMVPIPPEAKPAGYRPTAGCYSGDTRFCYRDGHMTVVSADRKMAWDFAQLGVDPKSDPNYAWVVPIMGSRDLTGDGVNQPYGSVPGWKNVRVAPVPLLHGLLMYEEIKRGSINHAVAFSTGISARAGSPGVYPCEGPNNGTSTEQWAPQLGFRLQLDPTLDINTLNLTPAGKIVARALQEYGMIFVENAGPGSNAVYAESLDDKPDKWNSVLGALSAIPLNRFRVVEPILPTR